MSAGFTDVSAGFTCFLCEAEHQATGTWRLARVTLLMQTVTVWVDHWPRPHPVSRAGVGGGS